MRKKEGEITPKRKREIETVCELYICVCIDACVCVCGSECVYLRYIESVIYSKATALIEYFRVARLESIWAREYVYAM